MVSACNKLVVRVTKFCRKPSWVILVQCSSKYHSYARSKVICLCVCMCVCMYMRVCVGMECVYMHVCVYMRVCVGMECVYMHVCVCGCAHINALYLSQL